GRPSTRSARTPVGDALTALLGQLSWKYVKEQAEFDPPKPVDDLALDELREKIGHWAGRVWFQSNEMPVGEELQAFDLMSLKAEFRKYIRTHGQGVFNEGMTIEEVWASQQFYSTTPMVTVSRDLMQT